MMHPRTFVAQTTCAHVNHFYRCVIDALEFDGPALITCFTTCQPEHGVADNMATDQAQLAVDSRAFPLLIYDPRKGNTIRERLTLQGNPSMKDDWWTNPKTGEVVDFIDFCRSEGRFAKHFDKEGNASELLELAREERLENWHLLQELAGHLGGGAAKQDKSSATKQTPKKPAASKPAKANGDSLPMGLSVGSKIKYNDGEQWIDGVLRADDPVVLALADNTKIEISRGLLKNACDAGIVRSQ